MSRWVNFKELRAKLSFEKVLQHYGVEVKTKGTQHTGFCPLPNHNGKKNSPSFSANLERGVFHCFGCQASGNVLEFAALMEGALLEDGAALRKVALELQRLFCPKAEAPKAERVKPEPQMVLPAAISEAAVNAPLDFELKHLDPAHPYLAGRGFTKETIARFGLGFCSKGYLAGRIAIPLHDSRGRLIGYAGRVVDDALISEENPRYRFPSKRERAGRTFEFRKMLFLYNGSILTESSKDLTVVEGFPSTWWLVQNGFPRVVATMGAECSDEQAALIVSLVRPDGRVRILPDGDKAGEKFALSLLQKLSPLRFVRWAKLEEGKQPTDLTAFELKALLED